MVEAPETVSPLVRLYQKARDGPGIETSVGVKVFVFGGDGGGNHKWGDFIQGNVGAAPGLRIDDLVQQVAVAVEDGGGLELGGALLQILYARQGGGNGIILKEAHGCQDQSQGDDGENGDDHPAQETPACLRPVHGPLGEDGLCPAPPRLAHLGNGFGN